MIDQIKFCRASKQFCWEQATLEQNSISFDGLAHLHWNYMEVGQHTYRARQGW